MTCLGCEKRKKWIACKLLAITDWFLDLDWGKIGSFSYFSLLGGLLCTPLCMLMIEEGFWGFLIVLAMCLCVVAIFFLLIILGFMIAERIQQMFYGVRRWAKEVCRKD
jgi:hypothetical protein